MSSIPNLSLLHVHSPNQIYPYLNNLPPPSFPHTFYWAKLYKQSPTKFTFPFVNFCLDWFMPLRLFHKQSCSDTKYSHPNILCTYPTNQLQGQIMIKNSQVSGANLPSHGWEHECLTSKRSALTSLHNIFNLKSSLICLG